MSFIFLENSLRGFIFTCLFLSMFLYWRKISFFSIKKHNNLEIFILSVSNFSLSFLLIMRWIEAKHFPLSNLYESLIFLCWGLTLLLLLLEIIIKENYIGIFITPIILMTNTFANFNLPLEMQKANALVPALQSNWLMMHVTIMMLGYVVLIFGSLLSIAFLMVNYLSSNYKKTTALILINIKNQTSNLIISDFLDNLSYRLLSVGFPLLTVGILSGAIWANETWGSYWSWDPKETWALITWVIYAIYLHSRIIKGWKGKKPAFIASLGFFLIWVSYLGVNIIGKGLHSYGWFNFV